MKKEVDTYKMKQLFDAFKKGMLWLWYGIGVTIAATLWVVQVPQTKAQCFAWIGAMVFYSALSATISKLDSLRTELE